MEAALTALGVVSAAAVTGGFGVWNARQARKAAERVEKKIETNGSRMDLGQLSEATYFLLREHLRTPNAHQFDREEKEK